MAMILNKVLNNDICDEMNKLVVNDTIKDLQEENEGYVDEIFSLKKNLEELDDEVAKLEDENGNLENENYDLRSELPTDIDDIICRMTSMGLRDMLKFDNFMNNICSEKGIAYDIAETYSDFDEWKHDVMYHYLEFVVNGEIYNVSTIDIFKAKTYHDDNYGEGFELDDDIDKFSRRVVFLLLKEILEEEETPRSRSVIESMRTWYTHSTEQEKRAEESETDSTDNDE